MTTATKTDLVARFKRLADRNAAPDAEIRAKLTRFRLAYIKSTGSDGANLREGAIRLSEVIERDPRAWPLDWPRLKELFAEIWNDPERLPPLSPRAQLVWLGTEVSYDNAAIDAAFLRQFPASTPNDIAAAFREAGGNLNQKALTLEMQAAVFQVWHDIHRARGRAEEELVFGNCVTQLDLVEKRDWRHFFNRLRLVADPELRIATMDAALQAAGRNIDPETAEIRWEFGQTIDPYGDERELPEECFQIGRNYFARAPGSDVWVGFCDLSESMREALRARMSHETRQAAERRSAMTYEDAYPAELDT